MSNAIFKYWLNTTFQIQCNIKNIWWSPSASNKNHRLRILHKYDLSLSPSISILTKPSPFYTWTKNQRWWSISLTIIDCLPSKAINIICKITNQSLKRWVNNNKSNTGYFGCMVVISTMMITHIFIMRQNPIWK